MRILRMTGQGAEALGRNKLRTFLMAAGPVVGICALTVIMAVGKGTEQEVRKRVENFGPRAMMLIAGGGKDLPPPDMSVTTLKLEDARALSQEIEGLEAVSPMAWMMRITLRRGSERSRSKIWGVEPSWHEAWGWFPSEGEGITEQDVATKARVCLIGQTVKRELFPGEDPLGQRLYANRVSLVVKGVLEERGVSPGGGDFDNRIVVPISTAMRRIMNVEHLGAIRIISKTPARIDEQAASIRAAMKRLHHITPPREDDFRIITPTIIAGVARGITGTLSILLLALTGLSLLVGGVVMMNILLVSVSERTREIGLRRALGATRGDVFHQFLTEALLVTVTGAVVGSGLGLAVCRILPTYTKLTVVLTWEPFALGVAFALLVGTVFGVHPARRAGRLHPVEALR